MAVSIEKQTDGYSDLRLLVDVNPPQFDFNQVQKVTTHFISTNVISTYMYSA